MLGIFGFTRHVFHKTVVIFIFEDYNPTVVGILKISFSLIFVIFLYKKTLKIRKKGIFKIRPTVGFRCQQLKTDNCTMNYMTTKIKNTERELHQLCISFFFFIVEKYFCPNILYIREHNRTIVNMLVFIMENPHEIRANFFFNHK